MQIVNEISENLKEEEISYSGNLNSGNTDAENLNDPGTINNPGSVNIPGPGNVNVPGSIDVPGLGDDPDSVNVPAPGNVNVPGYIEIEDPKNDVEKQRDIPGGDSNIGDNPIDPDTTIPSAEAAIEDEA